MCVSGEGEEGEGREKKEEVIVFTSCIRHYFQNQSL